MTPSAPAQPVLRALGLRVAHPGRPPLFEGLGFDLPLGLTRLDAEVGKTTLLRLLAGDCRGEGRFWLHGQPWHPADHPSAVCWIDPRAPAWDPMTPEQLRAVVSARHPGFDARAWQRQLEGFDLLDHGHKTMHMLSTGSRRKVALAAALAAQAPLTLLDEPVAGLDKPATDWLVAALSEQARPAGRAWLLAAAWGLEARLPWAAVLSF